MSKKKTIIKYKKMNKKENVQNIDLTILFKPKNKQGYFVILTKDEKIDILNYIERRQGGVIKANAVNNLELMSIEEVKDE